jgi:hypothetical protein
MSFLSSIGAFVVLAAVAFAFTSGVTWLLSRSWGRYLAVALGAILTFWIILCVVFPLFGILTFIWGFCELPQFFVSTYDCGLH